MQRKQQMNNATSQKTQPIEQQQTKIITQKQTQQIPQQNADIIPQQQNQATQINQHTEQIPQQQHQSQQQQKEENEKKITATKETQEEMKIFAKSQKPIKRPTGGVEIGGKAKAIPKKQSKDVDENDVIMTTEITQNNINQRNQTFFLMKQPASTQNEQEMKEQF